MYSDKIERAKEVADRGLQLDPQHEHCLNFRTKFGVEAGNAGRQWPNC